MSQTLHSAVAKGLREAGAILREQGAAEVSPFPKIFGLLMRHCCRRSIGGNGPKTFRTIHLQCDFSS